MISTHGFIICDTILSSLAGDSRVKNQDDLSADTMAKWVAVCTAYTLHIAQTNIGSFAEMLQDKLFSFASYPSKGTSAK